MCVFLNKQKKNTTNKDSVLFYSAHQYMWIQSSSHTGTIRGFFRLGFNPRPPYRGR